MSPTATTARITIERRFNGPPTSANGGYACGRVARLVDGPATVTLRRPVPLDAPLDAERHDDGRVTLHHDGVLLAEGEPALPLDLEPPRRPSVAEAREAARHGFADRPAGFAECYVCAPDRADGLGVSFGPLPADPAITAAPAAAQEHEGHGGERTAVAMAYAAFSPPAVDVLAGDTVTWSNVSVRRHDVAAVDGSWDSGTLAAGARYAHKFDTPGPAPYYCTIHPFMRGTVGVHELLLAAQREPGAPGRPLTLRGRTSLPAGTAIGIEADEGLGFAPVARTAAGDDGRFAATLRPRGSGRLRAVAGPAASPPVQLRVIDRAVAARARRLRGGRWLVRTRVLPASAGATVVLQLRLRERFGWWPVRRARLDGGSRARFRLRPPRSVRARVVLTLADGATALAVSPTLRLGPRRRPAHHR